jgi:hypothetical protein
MLVQRDEDVKSELTADKEKETISAITSIFQSIKLSEDAVDASKSKVGDFFILFLHKKLQIKGNERL